MRQCLIVVTSLVVGASGATRMYDVQPYQNCHGWTEQNLYVSQTFVNTCDSALTWTSFFVGAPNNSGSYHFEIRDQVSNDLIYTGDAEAGQQYDFVRGDLHHFGGAAGLIKGKTYVLKITHSAFEPINFYYDPTDPYPYGLVSVPGGQFHPPPQNYSPDLCARIEGVNKVITADVVEGKIVDVSVDSTWTEPVEPAIGKPTRFFVKVTNRGTAPWKPIAGKHSPLVVFTANGDQIAAASDLPALKPGGSTTVRSTGTWQPMAQGDCLICTAVNVAPNFAVESDPDNNRKWRMCHMP